MTITIDNPWQLLAFTVLALAVLFLALNVFLMTMWGVASGGLGWVGRIVGLLVTGGLIWGAVLLVMAGGGWL